MAETAIEWAHYTFNPWRGCTKVSAGCANCYAETLSKRNHKLLGIWGDNGTRPVAAESYWLLPYRWDRSVVSMQKPRVFCASLADWLEDRPELDTPLARLMNTIRDTPNLDWLLLTKRPENWRKRLEAARRTLLGMYADTNATRWVDMWLDGNPPPNVWVGASVEDQPNLDVRVGPLLEIPGVIHWLSVEPMLGPVDLKLCECQTCCHGEHPGECTDCAGWGEREGEECEKCNGDGSCQACGGKTRDARIDWVVCGGESGPKARPFDLAWARDLRDQCKAAGVAFFLKQLGSIPMSDSIETTLGRMESQYGDSFQLVLKDRKGGDPAEWPADMHEREFPNGRK